MPENVTDASQPATPAQRLTGDDGAVAHPGNPQAWWPGALAVLGYTLTTLYLFRPLIAQLNHAIAGPFPDGDGFYNVWHLWAARRALAAGQDPAFTNLIYALRPGQIQIFVEYFYSNLVGSVLQFVASPLATYNLLIISSFVLSGCTAYLLATHFLRNRLACFTAGWLYTFSTYHFNRAGGHLGLCTIQWLPLCAWRLLVFVERPSLRNAILAGITVALVPFSDVYYVACFLVPFGLVLLGRTLILQPRWFTARRHLVLAGAALLVAAGIAGPPLRSYFHMDAEMAESNRRMVAQTRDRGGADLAEYLLPLRNYPYLGHSTAAIYGRMTAIEKDAYPGGITLLLAAAALCFARARRTGALFWLAVAVTAAVFSLGPTIAVAGRIVGPSPVYNLVFGFPPLSQFRAPNRTSVLALLAAAMLAGYAVEILFARMASQPARRVLAGAVLAPVLWLALLDSSLWGMPYPSRPVSSPQLYEIIARDADDRILLNLPLASLESHQFYQTVHHKRLASGFVSRATPSMAQSLGSVANLNLFWVTNPSALQTVGFARNQRVVGAEHHTAPNPAFKAALLARGIRYVVLRHSTDADSQAWMRQYLLGSLGMPFYEVSSEGLTAWCLDVTCPGASTARPFDAH